MRPAHTILFIAACVIGAVSLPNPGAGQDIELTKLNARIESFFDNLTSEDVDPQKAFNNLLAPGPLGGGADEELEQMVQRYRSLEKYGAFLSVEAIDTKRIGQDLILLKYLYKAENHPVVWYFSFYRRPDTDWFVISVRFDTRIDLLGL